MAWPSAADFSEAVQNPRVAFGDAELQSGLPELNQMGIPKPRSGGFAVVFKLLCGSRNWAVKCFTRDFPDQQQRYAAISDYLNKKRLPYTVGFRYLADGIRVRGQMYPVLKMEWVEGENLRDYVERHLSQPQALRALANRWMNMISALRAASIAHGDSKTPTSSSFTMTSVLSTTTGCFYLRSRDMAAMRWGQGIINTPFEPRAISTHTWTTFRLGWSTCHCLLWPPSPTCGGDSGARRSG